MRAATMLALGIWLGIAAPAGAATRAEIIDACTIDALRWCWAEIRADPFHPDEVLIAACMRREWAHLSPACRAAINSSPR